MREIKFRAWDSKERIMICTGFSIIGEVTVFDMLNGKSIESYNDFVIMQYTGLKDSTGKDIYEHDILDYGPPNAIYLVKFGLYLPDDLKEFDNDDCLIVPHQYGWHTEKLGDGKLDSLTPYFDEDYTIIGNDYENPELLKNN